VKPPPLHCRTSHACSTHAPSHRSDPPSLICALLSHTCALERILLRKVLGRDETAQSRGAKGDGVREKASICSSCLCYSLTKYTRIHTHTHTHTHTHAIKRGVATVCRSGIWISRVTGSGLKIRGRTGLCIENTLQYTRNTQHHTATHWNTHTTHGTTLHHTAPHCTTASPLHRVLSRAVMVTGRGPCEMNTCEP